MRHAFDQGRLTWTGELESDRPLPSKSQSQGGRPSVSPIMTLETARMKAPWTDPVLRELLALAALAAFGLGMELAHGDLLFGAIFAAGTALIIVGAVRRLR